MTQDKEPAGAGTHPGEASGITTIGSEDPKQALRGAYEGLDLSSMTHRQLMDIVIRERGWAEASNAERSFRSWANTWCKNVGLSLDDPAHRSFGKGFEERLTAVTDNLIAEKSKTTVKSVRWAVTELKRTFDSIWTYAGLPSDFHLALSKAIDAKGWKPLDLIHAMNGQTGTMNNWMIYEYLRGTKSPVYPRSLPTVLNLEKALGLPENTLVSRAFKRPKLIKVGNNKKIAYRQSHARRCKSTYALKQLPDQFKQMWIDLIDWRSQPHLRVDGETYVPDNIWVGPNSPKKYQDNVRRFFGWLVLPKAKKPLKELTEEESWKVGKGMKVEELTLAHLFDVDLVWEYFEFMRCRQHNHSFTQDTKHYGIFLNSLVNHPYSFVKAHSNLAALFGEKPMQRAQWVEFVEAIHVRILKLCRDINKATPKNAKKTQRDAGEPLKEILGAGDPLEYVLLMIEDLEKRIPPASQKQDRAIYLRDIALFRIGVEVPLRAKNFAELEIGTSLVRTDENLWRVELPVKAMKNRHSPHARDIFRVLSVEASASIDRYLKEGRPVLRGADETKLFLLIGSSGPKRKLPENPTDYDRYGVRPASLYWVVRDRTEDAFGVGQGANAFRHIVATSILKDTGVTQQAAAALNNSAKMIEETYSHVVQDDYLHKNKSWFEEKLRNRKIKKEVLGD